jgi:hypothetical protein
MALETLVDAAGIEAVLQALVDVYRVLSCLIDLTQINVEEANKRHPWSVESK